MPKHVLTKIRLALGGGNGVAVELPEQQASTTQCPVESPAGKIHDFTGTTQSVEDSHIVTNTRNTYYPQP